MLKSIFSCALVVVALVLWSMGPPPSVAIMSGQQAPDLAGESWLNSRPLTIADLKGRVVLVEFWTYG